MTEWVKWLIGIIVFLIISITGIIIGKEGILKWKNEKAKRQQELEKIKLKQEFQAKEKEKNRVHEIAENERERQHKENLEKIKQEGLAFRLNEELETKIKIKKMELDQSNPFLVKRIELIRKEKKGKKTK